jgi:hypothetical protein
MRLRVEAPLSYFMPSATDVLLALEASPIDEQRLVEDKLIVSGHGASETLPGDEGSCRRTQTRGQGHFSAYYPGTFDLQRQPEPLPSLREGGTA